MAPRVSSLKGDTDFRLPLALAGSSLFVAGHLFFGCAQYAAGNKKVRFPFLSNKTFKISHVDMIRPNHGGEAIESPEPPLMESDGVEVGVKDTPPRFYQIVDSRVDGHCVLFLSIISALSLLIRLLRLDALGVCSFYSLVHRIKRRFILINGRSINPYGKLAFFVPIAGNGEMFLDGLSCRMVG